MAKAFESKLQAQATAEMFQVFGFYSWSSLFPMTLAFKRTLAYIVFLIASVYLVWEKTKYFIQKEVTWGLAFTQLGMEELEWRAGHDSKG